MEDKYIIAFEIGSSKIRGALAEVDASGNMNVITVNDERPVDSVRYGQVRNVEEVSNRIEAICRRIENARQVAGGKVTGIYVGVSGYTVSSFAERGAINFDEEKDITASVVADLSSRIATSHVSERENLAMLPVEFHVNNESTLTPVGRVGNTIRATYNIIEGTPAIKGNINRAVVERLGLKVNGYIISPIAVADAALTSEDKQLGAALVDFGAETTTVAIYKGGVLRFLITLPMGSRNITRDLTALNYSEEKADALKREIGVAANAEKSQYDIDQPDIANCISARASEIIANVKAMIEHAGYKADDLPNGIVAVGGGARLKGFTAMLADQTGMKVRMGQSPRNVRFSDNSISADDAIDIVALLAAAANDPKECIVMPREPEAQVNIVAEHRPDSTPYGVADDDDDDDRIGRLYDDDDLLDDDDDRKTRSGKKQQPKPTRQGEEKDRKNIFTKVAERLRNLMADNEGDKYDDDDDHLSRSPLSDDY